MVAQAKIYDADIGEQSASASTWRLLRGKEGLDRLAQAADSRAVPRSPDGLGDISCIEAAARAAEQSGSTVIVAENDNLGKELLLPLRGYRQMGVLHVVPLTAPLAQYAPDPVRPLCAGAIRGLLNMLGGQKGADLLLMRRVREDNPLSTGLKACGAVPADLCNAPYIDLEAFGSYQAYLSSFSRKSRRSRERGIGKLEEDHGKVGFKVVPGAEPAGVLAAALEWKRAWLRELGVASPVFDAGPWEAAFMECAAAPNAVLSILDAGGRPVAVELGFVTGADYASYFGAFDPAFGTYRVGQQQISRTVGWCFDRGIERYDLLAPCDSYKRFWIRSPTSILVADYAVPISGAGRIAAFAHRRLRPLAKRVRDITPRGLRRRMGSF